MRYLYEQIHNTCIGGTAEGIEPPAHYDFENLWDTPEGLRELFARMDWRRVPRGITPCTRVHGATDEVTNDRG